MLNDFGQLIEKIDPTVMLHFEALVFSNLFDFARM